MKYKTKRKLFHSCKICKHFFKSNIQNQIGVAKAYGNKKILDKHFLFKSKKLHSFVHSCIHNPCYEAARVESDSNF